MVPRNIGGNKTPIVDTWWQTETGGIMISPLPGVTSTKPGSAQRPLPGISAKIVDDAGKDVPHGGGGYLVLDQPWPGMLRTIWGDDDRYRETYWSRFADRGYYFAGDGAKYDADGDMWLLGRVDDVMNVSGHRISTTEVESALVSHPTVAEAAVVGATDATTGQGIVAFVILRGGVAVDEAKGQQAIQALRNHVAHEIGPIAKPTSDHGGSGTAEDQVRQDHAATAARRRGAPGDRRRDHAGRLVGDGPDLRGPAEGWLGGVTGRSRAKSGGESNTSTIPPTLSELAGSAVDTATDTVIDSATEDETPSSVEVETPKRGRPRKQSTARKTRTVELILTVTGTADGEWQAELTHSGKRVVQGLPVAAAAVSRAAKELHPEISGGIETVINAAREQHQARMEELQAELDKVKQALAELED